MAGAWISGLAGGAVVAVRYRAIDIGQREVAPRATGAAPRLEWVPVSRLVLDNDYQRPLAAGNWNQIQKIARAFAWSHFTPCLVAPVGDDMFALIDGQHRTHAAMICGLTEVPCSIVELDEAEQARAFVAVNAQVTAVKPHHVFKAALSSGDPTARAAVAVVEDAGARLVLGSASSLSKRAREVYCVAWVWDEVKAGRGKLVTHLLRGIAGCPDADDPWMWSYPFLSAFLRAVRKVPRAERRDLAPFLAAHSPRKVDAAIYMMRKQPAYVDRSHKSLMVDILQQQLTRWVADGAAA